MAKGPPTPGAGGMKLTNFPKAPRVQPPSAIPGAPPAAPVGMPAPKAPKPAATAPAPTGMPVATPGKRPLGPMGGMKIK